MTKEKLFEIITDLLKADSDPLKFLLKLETWELEILVAYIRDGVEQFRK
jgi:hypothetical protein